MPEEKTLPWSCDGCGEQAIEDSGHYIGPFWLCLECLHSIASGKGEKVAPVTHSAQKEAQNILMRAFGNWYLERLKKGDE